MSNTMQVPLEAVGLLLNLIESEEQPGPAVTLFLLGDILNRFNASDMSISSESQGQLVMVLHLQLVASLLIQLLMICRIS